MRDSERLPEVYCCCGASYRAHIDPMSGSTAIFVPACPRFMPRPEPGLAALAAARAEEREACYEAVRYAPWGEYVNLSVQQGMAQAIDNALAAIRARGEGEK